MFLKTLNPEYSYIEVWITDQNSKPLEIEDKINITLVVNSSVKYRNYSLFILPKRSNICKRLQIFFSC